MNINDFILKILSNQSNIQEKYSLGKLSSEEIEAIKNKLDIDLTGYNRVIENFGIYHALKHHGNIRTENARGQIPINLEDFEKIPQITKEPDDIKNLGKSKRGGIVLQFIKRIGNLFFYDEEVRNAKKELATKSMYKRR